MPQRPPIRDLPRALSVDLHLAAHPGAMRAQFRVRPGHVCALLSRPSEHGQTLLQALAGLHQPIAGHIALGGEVLLDSANRVNRPPHLRRLSWLDGSGALAPRMTVAEHLRLGFQVLGSRWDPLSATRAEPWIEAFGLAHLLKRLPHELSAAQRVRVALARSACAQVHGLLLDDPLAELEATDRHDIMSALSLMAMRLKIPVLWACSQIDDLSRLADDLVVLHKGQLLGAGAIEQLLSDVSLASFLDGHEACCLLEGDVIKHDLQWLLSEVDLGGQKLWVPATLHGLGSRVRLRFRGRDLSLRREVPSDSAHLNHLRGHIQRIMLAGEHGTYGLVLVNVANRAASDGLEPLASVWTLTTRKAIENMGWAPGQACILSLDPMAISVSSRR